MRECKEKNIFSTTPLGVTNQQHYLATLTSNTNQQHYLATLLGVVKAIIFFLCSQKIERTAMKQAISNTEYISSLKSESGKTLYRFCVSDERINRNGWKTLTEGIDFTNYLANPVVLFGHSAYSMPIGKAETVFAQDSKLFADIWIHEETELAATVKKLIDIGVINATSISIDVIEKGSPLPIPPELKDSFSWYTDHIEVYAKSELHEISVVIIPANAGATIQERVQAAYAGGSIDKSDIEFINKIIKNNEVEMPEIKPESSTAKTAEVESLLKANGALTGKIGELTEEIKSLKTSGKEALEKAAALESSLQAKDIELSELRANQTNLEVNAFIAQNSKKIMPKENENDALKNKLIALKQSGVLMPDGKTIYETECNSIIARSEFSGLGDSITSDLAQTSKSDLSDVDDFNKKKYGR